MTAAGPASREALSAPKSHPEPMIDPTLANSRPTMPMCLFRLGWSWSVGTAASVTIGPSLAPPVRPGLDVGLPIRCRSDTWGRSDPASGRGEVDRVPPRRTVRHHVHAGGGLGVAGAVGGAHG